MGQCHRAVLGQINDDEDNDDSNAAALPLLVRDREGTADLIVASSVMSYIPSDDLEATMAVLVRLLKPGGIFCHSDWPEEEVSPPLEQQQQQRQPHGPCMSHEQAAQMYALAGWLEAESIRTVPMDIGGGKSANVLIGIARKVVR